MKISSGFRLRVSRVLLSVLTVAAAALVPPAALAADDAVPPETRAEIEAVIRKKAADVREQKNSDGIAIKRATYSKSFKKVDDSTYQVTFHTDTVEDGALKSDQLKTERFLITVKKNGAKWEIAKEEVKDTFVGLYRPIFGTDAVYTFDKLAFEREGLKVTATNGSLYKYRMQGKAVGFRLVADDLAYQYAPPADVNGYYDLLQRRLAKAHPESLVFKPQYLTVECDPATCDELDKSAFTGLTKVDAAPAGSGHAAAALRATYDEARKDTDKKFQENPFGAFRFGYEPDHHYWSFEIKSSGAKDRSIALVYDSYEPWEIGFYATNYGKLYGYYAENVRKGGISPYDLERRDDLETRDYEVVGLKGSADLALEQSEALSGDVTYTIKTKRQLRELRFGISRLRAPGGDDSEARNPKLFINSLQDGAGEELTWAKVGAFQGVVVLPKEVPAGTDLTIRLQFQSYDSIYKLNPSYSALDRGGWLPFVGFGDMIYPFELTVRVPDRFRALGIGKKVSEEKKDGAQVTKWVASSPVSFPTIIFGDYIDDGPGFKATKKDGTEIPVRVYVDKVSTQSLDSFESAAAGARDIRGKQLKSIAEQAANALNLYREIYGVDYPFDKLDLVADPLGSFYGQAPASIVYLGFGVFRGEGEVAAGMFSGGSSISKFNKDVVAHEVAHQWWGSLVCNSNFRNYWFVESLAEYSSALFVENINGKNGRKKYLEKVADWRKNIIEADLVTPVQNGYTLWAGEDARGSSPPIANIYNKGPYAFHVLRETFGDQKFFAFLKELATSLQHEQIVTRDIQQVMEKAYGGNMDWFFDQWLRGVGTPQYALNWAVRQTEDGKFLVEGSIKQRVVFGKDNQEMKGTFYRAVAPLTFVTEDGKKVTAAKPMLVQGAETPFKLKLDFKPAEVLFNDEGEILAKDVLVNRSW